MNKFNPNRFQFVKNNLILSEFTLFISPIKTLQTVIHFFDIHKNLINNERYYEALFAVLIPVLLMTYVALHQTWLYFVSDYSNERFMLIHYDIFFYLIPTKRIVKIFNALVCLNAILISKEFYFKGKKRYTQKTYLLIEEVMIKNIFSSFHLKEYKGRPLNQWVQKVFYICSNVSQLFVFDAFMMNVLAFFMMQNQINKLCEPIKWFESIFYYFNMITWNFFILYIAHLYILEVSFIAVLFTMFYIQLKQIHQLLKNFMKSNQQINVFLLEKIRYYKVKLLINLINGNQCTNGHFVVFLITNLPINAGLTIWMMLGQIEYPNSLYFGMVGTYQILTIIGVHYVLMLPGKRIHQTGKLLLNTIANRPYNSGSSCKKRHNHKRIRHKIVYNKSLLHIEQLINVLHTRNPYGFTYGKAGLITIKSFLKV